MSAMHIAVVDGNPVQRAGIAAILSREPGFSVVGTYRTAQEMLTARQPANVIVLDEWLPDMPAALACERIRNELPDAVPIVIVDDKEPRELIDACVLGGAHHVITGTASAPELARAVRRAIHPAGLTRIRQSFPKPIIKGRQLAVIRSIAAGRTIEWIAKRLGVSVTTVKGDLRQVMTHLGVSGRSQAVAEAVRRGYA